MEQNSKADMVAIVNSLTDEELRGILEMERELFPESLQDFSYEKEMSAGKTAVVAYCPEGKVAGYIFAVPHCEAHAHLKDIDPNMPEVSDAHYIESIAIRSDLQGKGYFGKLMTKLKEATEGRPITMHARVCNNCSVAMQKHGAVHSHTVPNWFDSGEDFDYLEIKNG
ncbi:MAG: GNAT family N-acetyltransferase [Candidatus Parcubacteria bacterium]|nr:GNAT family N-acetyltransferase [Candidatus Parcubacteria bacterium]